MSAGAQTYLRHQGHQYLPMLNCMGAWQYGHMDGYPIDGGGGQYTGGG